MKSFALFVIVLAFVSSASALTLKEKKKFTEWQEYLKDPAQSYIGKVKEKCGVTVPVTLDEKMITPFMIDNANAASFCDEALATLSSMCEDATAKSMIVKNVKKLDCKLGKKGEAAFALKGGTFTFTYGTGASNLSEKTKEYLENNLQ